MSGEKKSPMKPSQPNNVSELALRRGYEQNHAIGISEQGTYTDGQPGIDTPSTTNATVGTLPHAPLDALDSSSDDDDDSFEAAPDTRRSLSKSGQPSKSRGEDPNGIYAEERWHAHSQQPFASSKSQDESSETRSTMQRFMTELWRPPGYKNSRSASASPAAVSTDSIPQNSEHVKRNTGGVLTKKTSKEESRPS